MEIHHLPREALFNLLLQIEPEELKTVCFSKNKKIREICNSEYFREVYGEKYPKSIMVTPIDNGMFREIENGFIVQNIQKDGKFQIIVKCIEVDYVRRDLNTEEKKLAIKMGLRLT